MHARTVRGEKKEEREKEREKEKVQRQRDSRREHNRPTGRTAVHGDDAWRRYKPALPRLPLLETVLFGRPLLGALVVGAACVARGVVDFGRDVWQ